jgi:hypothetical protein
MEINDFVDQALNQPLFDITATHLKIIGIAFVIFFVFWIVGFKIDDKATKKMDQAIKDEESFNPNAGISSAFLMVGALVIALGIVLFVGSNYLDQKDDAQLAALSAYVLAGQESFESQQQFLNKIELEEQFPGLKKLDDFDIGIDNFDNGFIAEVVYTRNGFFGKVISTCKVSYKNNILLWEGNLCDSSLAKLE